MRKKTGKVTLILLLINIIVYILGAVKMLPGLGDTASMFPVPADYILMPGRLPLDYETGGIYVPAVMGGEWWRILTALFIHGGFEHLLSNMLALYAIGFRLEDRMGSLRYGAVYMLSGIGSGLTVLGWDLFTGVYNMTVGASGAIFGLMGGLLAISLNKRDGIPGVSVRRLLFACILMLIPSSANISMSGHVGGLVSGFIAAYIIGMVFPVPARVEVLSDLPEDPFRT